MIISFVKIPPDGVDFSLTKEGISFVGKIHNKQNTFAECKGTIKGSISHLCDRCGDEFSLNLDENVKVLAHDGAISLDENELENIIEFFDGFINMDQIFISELESIKSDYYYCNNCK